MISRIENTWKYHTYHEVAALVGIGHEVAALGIIGLKVMISLSTGKGSHPS